MPTPDFPFGSPESIFDMRRSLGTVKFRTGGDSPRTLKGAEQVEFLHRPYKVGMGEKTGLAPPARVGFLPFGKGIFL